MKKILVTLLISIFIVSCTGNDTKEDSKNTEATISHSVRGSRFGYRQKETGVILDMFDTNRDFYNEEPVRW